MTEPSTLPARRLLLVHAHPDDESIGTGVTMARYAADGAAVTLVTCTRGEEGEVLVPSLAQLAAAADDQLGAHREVELAAAMVELGVTDHRFLGGSGRWRDSGMMGTPSNDRPDVFWRADLVEAAAELVSIIRETRPQVVVTYDTFGGYGHPDHIQAHRVAMYASLLAAAPSFRPDLGAGWDIAKIYWTAFPKSFVREGIAALRAMGEDTGFAAMDPDDIPFACDDVIITTVIDAQGESDKKMAAMRAHATQISVEDGFFALSNKLGSRAIGVEFYRLVRGETAGELDELGRETDLFAGI